jgi:hypothetical protein
MYTVEGYLGSPRRRLWHLPNTGRHVPGGLPGLGWREAHTAAISGKHALGDPTHTLLVLQG